MKTIKMVVAETPCRDMTLTYVEGRTRGTLETRVHGNRPLSYPGWDHEWLLVASVETVVLDGAGNDQMLWVTRPSDGSENRVEARNGFQSIVSTEYNGGLIHQPMIGLPRGVHKGIWTAADRSGCQWAFAAQEDRTWAVRRDPGLVLDEVAHEKVTFTQGARPMTGLPLDVTFEDETTRDSILEPLVVVKYEEMTDVRTLTKEAFLEREADRILKLEIMKGNVR